MKEIKVVGDIREGKFQPALTGNPIVDTALINQFCDHLSDWLTAHHLAYPVSAEHAFSVTNNANDDILYIVDKQILSVFNAHEVHQMHILPVDHQDLLHARPDPYFDAIVAILKSLAISK